MYETSLRPMPEDDHRFVALAPVFEPRTEGSVGPLLTAPRTLARCAAVTHESSEVGIRMTRQRIEARELFHGILPARVQPSVNESCTGDPLRERSSGEPSEELVASSRGEDIRKAIVRTESSRAGGDAKEVSVVIAKDTACVERVEQFECSERVWTSIDEIADGLEAITCGIEMNFVEQTLELCAAALNIADEDVSHGFELRSLQTIVYTTASSRTCSRSRNLSRPSRHVEREDLADRERDTRCVRPHR